MPIPYSNNTLHGGSINVDIDATGALEGETLYYDSTDAQFENNATLKIDPTTEAVNVAGDLALTRDGDTLKLGAGADFQAYHDGTNTEWINNTGDFIIRGEGGDTRFMVNSANLKVQDTTTPTPNDVLVVDTANRRVGINRIPTEDLDVSGNIQLNNNATGKIVFYDDNDGHEHAEIDAEDDGTTGGQFKFKVKADGGSVGTALTIRQDGKVGIGTTIPDEKLHLVEDSFTTRSVVKQETLFNGAVSIADCSNYAQSTLRSDGAVQDGDFLGSFNIGGGTTAGTQGDPSTFGATSGIRISGKAKGDFSTASGRLTEFIIEKRTGASGLVNAFTIDKDNNVGIGTDTPASLNAGITALSISDAGGKTIGDSIGELNFITNDTSFTGAYFADGIGSSIRAITETATGAGFGLSFTTAVGASRDERVRIKSDGKVGIGTDTPNTNLQIKKQNDGGDVGMRIQNSTTTAGSTASLYFTTSTNDAFNSAFVGSDRNNSLLLGADEYGRMTILNNGNIKVSFNPGSGNIYFQDETNSGSMFYIQPAIYSGTAPYNYNILNCANSSHFKVVAGGADRFEVKSDGNILMPTLPTSSAGLPSGALWNDLGTLKIA